VISMRPIGREQRVLVIGGGFVLALVVLGRGVPTLLRWHAESRSTVSELRGQVARADQLVGTATAVRDSATMRGRRLIALAPLLLDGTTSSAATATLASLVSGAAAKANIRLGSLQLAVDSSHDDTFARVSVRGNATGDVRGLSSLLTQLERGPTLLAVRELSIFQSDPTTPSDQIETLQMEFVIEGLSLAPHAGAHK
jgi:hypothetical protein